MRKFVVLVAVLMISSMALATTWNNATLIDSMCAKKAKDNPSAHTRDCALACAGNGLGILTKDGKFIKFDKKGQEQAEKMLKSSDKKDNLKVTVDGEEKNNEIAVKSIKFE